MLLAAAGGGGVALLLGALYASRRRRGSGALLTADAARVKVRPGPSNSGSAFFRMGSRGDVNKLRSDLAAMRSGGEGGAAAGKKGARKKEK